MELDYVKLKEKIRIRNKCVGFYLLADINHIYWVLHIYIITLSINNELEF